MLLVIRSVIKKCRNVGLQRSPRLPSWILGALLLREGRGTGEGREKGEGKGKEGKGRGGKGEGRGPPRFHILENTLIGRVRLCTFVFTRNVLSYPRFCSIDNQLKFGTQVDVFNDDATLQSTLHYTLHYSS